MKAGTLRLSQVSQVLCKLISRHGTEMGTRHRRGHNPSHINVDGTGILRQLNKIPVEGKQVIKIEHWK